MLHIFGNLKKYWYAVIMILLLLVVQAYCDLALPDYTSNIIDVGISNNGIEHTMPEYISTSSFKTLEVFLTEEERADIESAYEFNKEKDYFRLKNTDEEYWQDLDEEFKEPIAIVYMMTMQKQSKDLKTSKYQEQLKNASPIEIREMISSKMSSLGDTMLQSMGKAYAKAEYKSCGINLNKMQSSYMWKVGSRMLLMALIMAIAAVIIGYIASKVAAGIGRDLRSKVFKKVIGFSNAEIDQFSTASLITRNTNDIQQIQMVTVMLLRIVLYAPILAIGGIINIRHYNTGMGWIIVLAVALVVSIIGVLLVFTMPKFKIMQDKVDRVNLISREILTGLPVIRAFSREKREEERFEEANSELTRIMLFTNRAMAIMMPALMVVMNGVSVLIIWVASKKIDSGIMEVGTMTAFITYSMLIIMGFLMITMIAIMLPRAGVAANRIQEVLDTENVIVDAKDAVVDKATEGIVKFEHVSFKYPDGEENVLEDIDFEAKPGQTTAIIGSTGCGKSTLVKLIPRLFDVTQGKITLDGVDIKDISIKTLREQIGYVPQKGVLFSGNIKSNIAYGTDDDSLENVRQAAEVAQAIDFINEKTEKFESPIAQGGTNVSGGQKQRLSIARAIARNPKIYIFDDSFSALDFKTDTELRKALGAKTSDATVFIVAQRVSTILNADQILVLEDGKLMGKGKHKELVEKCEEYRQIAISQLSEEEFQSSIHTGKEGC